MEPSELQTNPAHGMRVHSGWHSRLWVMGIFLLALVLRLWQLDEAPRDFWTVRQYFVPLLARAMYLEQIPGLPPWQAELVRAHKQAFQGRELPIMERVGVSVFRKIGGPAFWPLRIQPVLAWIAGGVFLFLIARTLFSFRTAVIGVLFYLFLPYGVTASRSLQPDSLMVMMLLASIWYMVRYHEKPGWWTWASCAVVSGLAILVKPGISQFAISATYLFLEIERLGWRRTLQELRTYLFYVVAALPTVGYMWVQSSPGGGGSLSMFFDWNFQPHLIPTLYFWRGWLGILIQILGFPALVLAAWGFVRAPSRGAFALMLGFGLGYLAQCFFTIAATASHDYWHLQVIPLVALGVGCAGDWALGAAGRLPYVKVKQGLVWVLGFSWLAFALSSVITDGLRTKNLAYIQMAEAIGDAVGHSANTLILDYDKGYPLMYFANIYGQPWPETAAMRFGHILGVAEDREDAGLSAAERYRRFFSEKPADFFIVCRALQELDLQPGLRDFLYSNFPLLASGDRFLIFDLRGRTPS